MRKSWKIAKFQKFEIFFTRKFRFFCLQLIVFTTVISSKGNRFWSNEKCLDSRSCDRLMIQFDSALMLQVHLVWFVIECTCFPMSCFFPFCVVFVWLSSPAFSTCIFPLTYIFLWLLTWIIYLFILLLLHILDLFYYALFNGNTLCKKLC